MKVWVKYREVGDKGFDYELVDLIEAADDAMPSANWDDDGWVTDWEENLNMTIEGFLNNRAACIRGDYWFGAEWDWTLVDKPPVTFFLTNIEFHCKLMNDYRKQMEQDIADLADYYINPHMKEDNDDKRGQTS